LTELVDYGGQCCIWRYEGHIGVSTVRCLADSGALVVIVILSIVSVT
jgi:hypothetical protein